MKFVCALLVGFPAIASAVTYNIPANTAGMSGFNNNGGSNPIQANQSITFHGLGSGSDGNAAGGFTVQTPSGTPTDSVSSLIDTSVNLPFDRGDRIDLFTAWGSVNINSGTGRVGNNLFQFGLTSATDATSYALGVSNDALFFNGLESAVNFVGFAGSDPSANNIDVEFGVANEQGLITGNDAIGTGNLDIFVAGQPTFTGPENYFLISSSFVRNNDDSISYGFNVDVFDGFNNTLGTADFTNVFSSFGTLTPAEHGLTLSSTPGQTFRPAIGYDVSGGALVGTTGSSYDWDNSLETFTTTPQVPEPSAFILLSCAAAGILGRRRRGN